ncbi:hypothetical protein BKP45_07085 [Anaerobacillus alkalidiazotrophicus]|uniref:UPF0309 protein BKP45_07085 n=1 Tax=Anaerobacillus alkalidiazotrophicus TaxID=472963 RepID=A0A1S2MD82_9BACI|nr:SIS domain-containing protein [Anaerobacillus alkalidiazotrophicus]OIJ22393.1 hypothetical protein BKP45_07085 [Anaerobacillus alkalidiazotrophicus]
MITQYFENIHKLLYTVEQNEKAKLYLAAEKIATGIQNDGIVYLFGCGHSHLLTEEVFYRAGGLVPISPIFVEELMLHKGALRSSSLERKNDYAKSFMNEIKINSNDVMIVISTSGRNPVPIDVALYGKEKGAFVIGISSETYSKSQKSKHTTGKYLCDTVDLHIDNHSVKGDALVTHHMSSVAFGPSSTVIGAAILNSIMVEAIKVMLENGYEAPVFKSGNLEHADEYNLQLIKKYKERISLF